MIRQAVRNFELNVIAFRKAAESYFVPYICILVFRSVQITSAKVLGDRKFGVFS